MVLFLFHEGHRKTISCMARTTILHLGGSRAGVVLLAIQGTIPLAL
jgi:hypothetical protein